MARRPAGCVAAARWRPIHGRRGGSPPGPTVRGARPGRPCRLAAAPAACSGRASSCWRGGRRRAGLRSRPADLALPPPPPYGQGRGPALSATAVAVASGGRTDGGRRLASRGRGWRRGSRATAGATFGPLRRGGAQPGGVPADRCARVRRTTTWSWPGPPGSAPGPPCPGRPRGADAAGARRRHGARFSSPAAAVLLERTPPLACRPRSPTSSGPERRWASRTARRWSAWQGVDAGRVVVRLATLGDAAMPRTLRVPATTPPSSTTCSSPPGEIAVAWHAVDSAGVSDGGHVATGPAGGALLTDELLPGQAGVIGNPARGGTAGPACGMERPRGTVERRPGFGARRRPLRAPGAPGLRRTSAGAGDLSSSDRALSAVGTNAPATPSGDALGQSTSWDDTGATSVGRRGVSS